MSYFVHLYDRFFLLLFFYLIFEFLSIFIVMIKIDKIELINAPENCLLNIFYQHFLPKFTNIISFTNIFNFQPTEIFLIYPILIWSISRGLYIIWTNILYNTLSNKLELEVFYQENFLVRKKW